jgi:hypothetical protein
MTIEVLNFTPNMAYTIAASTTTSNTALTQPPAVSGSAGNAGGYVNVVVYNSTNGVAFLQFGNASQTATTSSIYQVGPGVTMDFGLASAYTNVGVILSVGATSGNVYLMLGSGS